MEAAAKLVTAFAALIGAMAWPAGLFFFVIYFRAEIRKAIAGVPLFLDRVRKMKVAGIEAELNDLADKAGENEKGEVTVDQTRAAANLMIESDALGEDNILKELDKLCLQYDTIRRSMPASRARTQEMTRILVKMRAIGPSAVQHIEVYKSSGSAGSRLAAVAMMQMTPDIADLSWLVDRFRSEKPFLLYHAALALTNAANARDGDERNEVILAATKALAILRAFSGEPDRNTVEVLEKLIAL